MKSEKEDIYNNLGQININDTKIDSNTVYVTPSCIFCGNQINSFGKFICNDCRDVIGLIVRNIRSKNIRIEKQQKENTLKEHETICPCCNSSNTQYIYSIMLLYDHLDLEENYNKDGHCLSKHFICRDCLKEFDISMEDKKNK